MFQSFDQLSPKAHTPDRLAALRSRLEARGLAAFLIPHADEHQGEYIPANAERLAWITGFTGSAGSAVVATSAAALFVDGRYTLQARNQIDGRLFQIRQLPEATLSSWLSETLESGDVIGFDPRLHTVGEVDRLTSALKPRGIRLRAEPKNPIDALWGRERPRSSGSPVNAHPVRFAGKSVAKKLADVRKQLASDGQDALVLTLSDSVSWLFNLRGSEVVHTPVVLAYAIIEHDRAQLFLESERLTADARSQLKSAVEVVAPSGFKAALGTLKAAGGKVRLDPETASWWVAQALGGTKRIAAGVDPTIRMKAVKSEAEIAGARAAHERDGVAMARFLAWLEDAAAAGELDEIAVVEHLEACRRDTGELREISFDTICGSGPNGAIVHYRVNRTSNRQVRSGELLLIDSGGQYRDGTTDVTRTVAIGTPTHEMRHRFTLVLKGHIAVATSRFPKGTRGVDLDAFARRALWNAGLDYDHGTGHGVGSFLAVHEGPQSISKRGLAAIEAGMIVSNEPGYYKAGAYGIRIENLLLVTPAEEIDEGERAMMGFETLTLVPIDRRLIDVEVLSASEIAWIDAYHARVRDVLLPSLDPAVCEWLEAATEPL